MTGLAREDTDSEDVEVYVREAVGALGLSLDDTALRRVTETFVRNARIAALVMSFDLPESEEPIALTRLD